MTIPESLLSCLALFEPCFSAPSCRRFLPLMRGWLVCVGKRTVTGVMRAAGVAEQDASGFQRFFSRGAWSPGDVVRVVLQMVLKLQGARKAQEIREQARRRLKTAKLEASAGRWKRLSAGPRADSASKTLTTAPSTRYSAPRRWRCGPTRSS